MRNVNEQSNQVKLGLCLGLCLGLGLGLACIKRAADGMVSDSSSDVEEEKSEGGLIIKLNGI